MRLHRGPVAVGLPWTLPAGTAIFFEGNSNTAYGFNPLNWSKWAVQLSGNRVWIPPGGHKATGGSTVAYSNSNNSMLGRLPDLLALLNATPGPKIVWFMIGTNAEAGQATSFPATTELASWVAQVRATGAQVWANTCFAQKDGSNLSRVTAQNNWIRTPGNVDAFLDVNPGLFTNSNGNDNTHLSAAQHRQIGEAAADMIRRYVRDVTPAAQRAFVETVYSPDITGFTAKSGTGFSGDFPANWTPARTTGTGTMVGSATTLEGQPAMQIVCSNPAGAANSTFRLRRVVNTNRVSGDVLDAWVRVAWTASNVSTLAYAGLVAANGNWPNALIGGLDYPFPEAQGPHWWRTYGSALDGVGSSYNFDIFLTLRAGDEVTFVFAQPQMAYVGGGAVVGPFNTSLPVMTGFSVGSAPTHTSGTWGGSPTPTLSFAYYLDNTAIDSTYVLQGGDVGKQLYVLETASNPGGNPSVSSNTVTVQAAPSVQTAAWDGTLPSGTTPQLAYSDGNKRVSTTAATNSARFTRTPTSMAKTTGKWYFRVLFDGATGASRSFGVGTSVVGGNNGLTGGTVGSQRFAWAGTTLATGVNTAMGTNINLTNGEYECCFDADARLIWVRIAGGNWNNSATANPATGVGGISISGSGTDALMPICGLPSTSSLSGAAFVNGTPPSGFTQVS